MDIKIKKKISLENIFDYFFPKDSSVKIMKYHHHQSPHRYRIQLTVKRYQSPWQIRWQTGSPSKRCYKKVKWNSLKAMTGNRHMTTKPYLNVFCVRSVINVRTVCKENHYLENIALRFRFLKPLSPDQIYIFF